MSFAAPPPWEPDATYATWITAYRRFWMACFDAIREHDSSLITPNFERFALLMRVLVAREDGELPAWEGICVVRERRV